MRSCPQIRHGAIRRCRNARVSSLLSGKKQAVHSRYAWINANEVMKAKHLCDARRWFQLLPLYTLVFSRGKKGPDSPENTHLLSASVGLLKSCFHPDIIVGIQDKRKLKQVQFWKLLFSVRYILALRSISGSRYRCKFICVCKMANSCRL